MPNRELFSGVVTFLMTDVEGSTRLWEESAEKMGAAMRLHDELAAEIVEANGGIVVKERGEGDALFCVFERSSDAVRAAMDVQRRFAKTDWPTSRPIRVRFALHVGETELRSGDYYGPVVNRCARLRSICYGQQIILSEAVKSLLPSEEFELLDLGSHRLKDLSTPEQVFQVVAPDLPADFPPLLSLGNFPNNLPQHASSFVGREKESKEVLAAIRKNRLVTLAGPGGTGKTRLSQHAAEELLEEFADGLWLIELDRIQEADGIVSEMAQVLKIPEAGNQTPMANLIASIETKKMLFILDNCEHVRSHAAAFVSELLRKTEHIKVLATSREPLGITGETLYRVPSLGIPSDEAETPLALMGYESVQLFLERGQAVRQDLELTAANAAAVSRICRQLDGIPFALELAAARARALSVEQIADRLDDRFRVLGKGDTTRASRQHTLKALIDWSYELLSPPEQCLLNRLSCFVGGCNLEAAEVVAGFDPIDEYEVLDHLVSLVDKSLVVYDSEVQRYRLLETMRQYGREKLEEAGEAENVNGRHADYFFGQSSEAREGLQGRDPKAWMDRIDSDLDNFRATIRHFQAHEPKNQVDMLVSLFRYFDAQAIYAEPREQMESALPHISQEEDPALIGVVYQVLGNFARRQGDFGAANDYLTKAIEVLSATNDKSKVVSASINLATIQLFLGNPELAERTAQAAIAVCAEIKDYRSLVTAHLILGNSLSMRDSKRTATAEFQEALNLSKTHSIPDLQLYAQVNFGLNLSKLGNYAEAVTQFTEVLMLANRMGVRAIVLDVLRFLPQALVGLERWEFAASLYGLEAHLRDKAGIKLSEADDAEREGDIAKIRGALSSDQFEKSIGRFREEPLNSVLEQISAEIP